MATDSTVAGFLPQTTGPVYGDELEDLFSIAIQGILGWPDGKLIRPRWQPEPPNQPKLDSNWVAFGVTVNDSDRYAYQVHDPTADAGDGINIVQNNEMIKVLISFYGPRGDEYQKAWSAGLMVDQNRDQLAAAGIKLTEIQEAVTLPALLKEKWVRRVDSTAVFRRVVRRTYAIRHFLSASGYINSESLLNTFVVTQ